MTVVCLFILFVKCWTCFLKSSTKIRTFVHPSLWKNTSFPAKFWWHPVYLLSYCFPMFSFDKFPRQNQQAWYCVITLHYLAPEYPAVSKFPVYIFTQSTQKNIIIINHYITILYEIVQALGLPTSLVNVQHFSPKRIWYSKGPRRSFSCVALRKFRKDCNKILHASKWGHFLEPSNRSVIMGSIRCSSAHMK